MDEGRSKVFVSARAACPFSIAEEYAVQYLRRAEQGGTEGAILSHPVRLRFGLHLDIREEGRSHNEIRLQWASGSRFLPDFRGTLRFRIAEIGTEVLIDGSYQPPLGSVGAMFDRLIGGWIAHVSLQDFANRLASYLTEQERLWRSAHPS